MINISHWFVAEYIPNSPNEDNLVIKKTPPKLQIFILISCNAIGNEKRNNSLTKLHVCCPGNFSLCNVMTHNFYNN